MRAGDRAASRSAYQEAVAHFSAGLKAAEALPASADRTRRQLDFLLKLGPALIVTRGMGSPEVEDAYRHAAEMGEATGDEPATFKAKWGLWLNANIRRKTALARDRADELLALAQRSGDGDLMLEAHHCRWSTAFFRGDVAATLSNCRIGSATYDIGRHRHLGHAFGGHDPGVCAEVCGVMALQMAGDKTDAARAAATYPCRSARPSQHPRSCPAQYRYRSPVGRRSRRCLCGREPRRGAGAEVRADAMARQQPAADRLG
jgi:hypothetical protein